MSTTVYDDALLLDESGRVDPSSLIGWAGSGDVSFGGTLDFVNLQNKGQIQVEYGDAIAHFLIGHERREAQLRRQIRYKNISNGYQQH